MTMPFTLPFPMPGDGAILAQVLARKGGIAAAPAALQPYLGRAIVGLDLMGLVAQAEVAAPEAAGPLYEIWLAAHGAEMQACAAWLAGRCRRMGLETEVCPTPGHPVVLARTPRRRSAPCRVVRKASSSSTSRAVPMRRVTTGSSA